MSSSSVLFHLSQLSRQSTIVLEHYSSLDALLMSYVTGFTKWFTLRHHASSSYQYHMSKVIPAMNSLMVYVTVFAKNFLRSKEVSHDPD